MGASWLLWLIGVVVATDVAGYFAGKMIGGPKLWPRVSPKKTWSGSSAGWIAAAIVGAFFSEASGLGVGAIVLSVVMSMASQAGDIAESALKRKTGVKDSSALIPGHGGLFDRFDGMLGAAAAFLIFVTFLG
jgi:phosphatidate cytidylyltransferase